ncbi:MAG: hypothetical protein O9284_01070 [Steroidobacteraceae bacterium]|jgi:hypothetical protein|nr:hypothetical protein [Steroidobacteraceae bacterium]
MNFLEQLCAEWLEYCGYFVRRNVHVGKRPQGGFECELDVVALHPKSRHLVHVEPSMDAGSWETRALRYQKKFDAGQKYIPGLFDGLGATADIDQVALFGLGSRKTHPTLAGGRVMIAPELIAEIQAVLATRHYASQAVPEQYVCLRTLQFAVHAGHAGMGDERLARVVEEA